MNEFLEKIRTMINSGDVRVSEHGFDELSEDQISVRDAISGVGKAVVVEEYPSTGRGPAVLVTACRPDPDQWEENFMQRRK